MKSGAKKIIMCVNELSYSGVPVYTKNLCQLLKEYEFCIWSLSDGEYRREFEKLGIPVEIINDIQQVKEKIENCGETYAACMIHSAYSYQLYEAISAYLPTVWYIHEGKLLQYLCNLWEELRILLRNALNIVCVSEYAADIVKVVSGNNGVKVINNIAFVAEGAESPKETPDFTPPRKQNSVRAAWNN